MSCNNNQELLKKFASMGAMDLLNEAMQPYAKKHDPIFQPILKNYHPYPRYELSNGLIVDFMCMSKDDIELYHTLTKSKLLYDRDNKTWWLGDDQEYPKRTKPLFGVIIEKEIW